MFRVERRLVGFQLAGWRASGVKWDSCWFFDVYIWTVHTSPTSVLASILHLTIASLPSSPSTAAPVPSSCNHQPPATATTPPPFSLSLARALAFSLSNTHSALPQFVCFGYFPFWVEVLLSLRCQC